MRKAVLSLKGTRSSETTISSDSKWALVTYIFMLKQIIGAFGEVRMCQHKKLRAIRAVKILKKSALMEDEIKRFIHEIEILKTLVRESPLS